MRTKITFLALTLLVAGAGFTPAVARPLPVAKADVVHGQSTDDSVAHLLRQRLAKRELDHVDVVVRNGEVTLEGTVDTLRHRAMAEKMAREFEEAAEIHNLIEVTKGDRTAADIVADVTNSLSNPIYNTVFDWVEADVNGYDVVLRGWVTDPWKVNAATRSMQSIPAVQSVTSKIEVLPVSSYDDEIRVQAAALIFGDFAFADYIHRANPPIHIVVRNGELILEGTVRNRAEKMLAQSLASSGTLPFRIVNQLRTESEVAR